MFKSVTFYTNKLKALKRFYGDVMEFNIVESTNEQFIVEIGQSTITFMHTNQPAFYHFAINIPGNQFSMLKFWMQDRVTLNRGESLDEIYFSSFDADSMYFEDPAGNIVELIGRRKQDLFGDVSQASFLNISEVGIVTPFVSEVGEQLQDIGIPLRGGTEVDPESLNFLGKGDAFIVLVPPARRWYFSEKSAETYPLEITLNDGRQIVLDEEGKMALIN
ncbi:glyoxalase [Sporosarcina sp. FA9]|uniref:glyoxalase n=1 Tax=Sporosarcina sp. FA9 TaxID=3413030 RepID=UPI003F65E213